MKTQFYNKVKQVAENNAMACELRENYYRDGTYTVSVSFQFSDVFRTHSRTLMRHIKPLKGGKVNFWEVTIHDCKHHISGPGYYSWPNYDHIYKNVELTEVLQDFIREIENDARFYRPNS